MSAILLAAICINIDDQQNFEIGRKTLNFNKEEGSFRLIFSTSPSPHFYVRLTNVHFENARYFIIPGAQNRTR